MSAPRRSEGFTILELMVALVAGAIAITSVYFVGAASTRHFQTQQRIAQTQSSLRIAMEQLRRDIARAGFLGTPNSRTDQRCVAPAAEIQGIEIVDDADTAALPNAAENLVSADRIRLIGNYATSDAYLAIGLDSTGGRVFLQRNWQAFRRSFGEPFSTTSFTEAFKVGRMLHIRTLQNNHFYVRITSVNAAQASVAFTPNIGVGGHCVVGLADGAFVSPLVRIEYLVTDLSAGALGANLVPVGGRVTDPNTDYLGQSASQLVRREIAFPGGDPSGDATSPNQRIVLEYVADVNYDAVVDTAAAGLPPVFARRAGAAAEAATTGAPQSVRSVFARISARTAEHDTRFEWVPRAAGDPLTRYRVIPTGAASAPAGAARVRTAEVEIFMPNLVSQ